MVRLVSFLTLTVVLLASATTANFHDLVGTSWDLEGKLWVNLPRVDRFTDTVDGTVVFRDTDNPYDEWCTVSLFWDELLVFEGTPRYFFTDRLILDPGEGQTQISFDNAFGAAIRGYLESRLRTTSLDSLELEIYILDTSLRDYRQAGQDRIRVWVDALFRYTGRKGGDSERINLKVRFRGTGPRQMAPA